MLCCKGGVPMGDVKVGGTGFGVHLSLLLMMRNGSYT